MDEVQLPTPVDEPDAEDELLVANRVQGIAVFDELLDHRGAGIAVIELLHEADLRGGIRYLTTPVANRCTRHDYASITSKHARIVSVPELSSLMSSDSSVSANTIPNSNSSAPTAACVKHSPSLVLTDNQQTVRVPFLLNAIVSVRGPPELFCP